jgi:hypothetical protein
MLRVAGDAMQVSLAPLAQPSQFDTCGGSAEKRTEGSQA